MKKLSMSIALFLGMLTLAQNRFYYEYKFVPDSTNRADVKSEMMVLDIEEKGSKYYSLENFKSDSAMQADVKKQAMGGSITVMQGRKRGLVKYAVTKSYPDYKTTLHTQISRDRYAVLEDEKPVWKISDEKQKIGDYMAQKATTNFGGKSWTAWFSPDLPFQDGPYKLYGLPGLIVKLEDKNKAHIITMVGNKKYIPVTEEQIKMPDGIQIFGMNKELAISEKQFKKIWKDYNLDPSKSLREMFAATGGSNAVKIVGMSVDGKEINDANEIARQMEKSAKENIAKNNDLIEPDLYKIK